MTPPWLNNSKIYSPICTFRNGKITCPKTSFKPLSRPSWKAFSKIPLNSWTSCSISSNAVLKTPTLKIYSKKSSKAPKSHKWSVEPANKNVNDSKLSSPTVSKLLASTISTLPCKPCTTVKLFPTVCAKTVAKELTPPKGPWYKTCPTCFSFPSKESSSTTTSSWTPKSTPGSNSRPSSTFNPTQKKAYS